MNKEYNKYFKRKKYLKISRLNASLIGMFVFIFSIFIFYQDLFAGIVFTSVSLGLLWYLVIDIMGDKYEDRLIDYEELHKIKKGRKKWLKK